MKQTKLNFVKQNRKRTYEAGVQHLEQFRYSFNPKRKTTEHLRAKPPELPFVVMKLIDSYLDHDMCSTEECNQCHSSSFRSLYPHYLRDMLRHLSTEGNPLPEQTDAIMEMINGKRHFVLLGFPGTGKSATLRLFRRALRWLGYTYKDTVCLAHTGIAAVNVNGHTIDSVYGSRIKDIEHTWDTEASWFGRNDKLHKSTPELQESTGYMVVDEVSQVCKDRFNMLLHIATSQKKKLVAVGDLMQLPPVKKEDKICIIGNQFLHLFKCHVLTKILRQDPHETALVSLIRSIGFGTNEAYAQWLVDQRHEAYTTLLDEQKQNLVHLCARNKDVDSYNREMYRKAEGREFFHVAEIFGIYREYRDRDMSCERCKIWRCKTCTGTPYSCEKNCKVLAYCDACIKKKEVQECFSILGDKTCVPGNRKPRYPGEFEYYMSPTRQTYEKIKAKRDEQSCQVTDSNRDILNKYPELRKELNSKRVHYEQKVALKPGIRVMVTRNVNHVLVNGTTATLVHIDRGEALIRVDNTNETVSLPFRTYRMYFKPKKTSQDTVSFYATVAYFPLKCCFACTIHKAQGLTLPGAIIDIGPWSQRHMIKSAILYVALSRCTTLSRVFIKTWFPVSIIQTDAKCIAVFNHLLSMSVSQNGQPFDLGETK